MARPRPPEPRPVRVLAVVLLGAAAGGLVGALVYEWLAPGLDARTDWLRDVQGLLWNLVPVLAVVGGLVALALARRRW